MARKDTSSLVVTYAFMQQCEQPQRVTKETPLNELSDVGLNQRDGRYSIDRLTA